MTFNELLHVFWRRKLLIAAVTAAVIGLAYVGTKLVEPRYESTATLALSPQNLNNDLIFFGTLDAIVPVYADAATSQTTLNAAEQQLGSPVENVTVQTFKGTGLIKIKARSTDPEVAQRRAEAVAQTMVRRSASGDIGLESLELTEIDKATLPTDPVFPRTKLTLLVGALLGLGLGLGAALLRDNLTTRIETPDQLAHATGLPVYAEVPAENAVLKMHKVDDLTHNKRLRIVAEALRELRTNLLFSDDSIRSVVVTSPDGSHGKTTISFGLAVTFARTGTRTLLVDGDLRRGRLAELLEIERAPGLMDVLLDEVSLEGAVRETALDTLHVLTAGGRAGDPGELLGTEFPALLTRLEEEYEAIVIDATPVVPITDARIMARYADATVLVTSAGRTRRRQIKTAIERLNLISVTPAAAVLNNSRKVRGSSYYTGPAGEGAEELRPRSRTRGAASR